MEADLGSKCRDTIQVKKKTKIIIICGSLHCSGKQICVKWPLLTAALSPRCSHLLKERPVLSTPVSLKAVESLSVPSPPPVHSVGWHRPLSSLSHTSTTIWFSLKLTADVQQASFCPKLNWCVMPFHLARSTWHVHTWRIFVAFRGALLMSC